LILAVIAAIGVPSYRSYKKRGPTWGATMGPLMTIANSDQSIPTQSTNSTPPRPGDSFGFDTFARIPGRSSRMLSFFTGSARKGQMRKDKNLVPPKSSIRHYSVARTTVRLPLTVPFSRRRHFGQTMEIHWHCVEILRAIKTKRKRRFYGAESGAGSLTIHLSALVQMICAQSSSSSGSRYG